MESRRDGRAGHGQLLIADQTRGTAKRVRGYALLTEKTLREQIQEES